MFEIVFDVVIRCWGDLETVSVSGNQVATVGARDLLTHFCVPAVKPRVTSSSGRRCRSPGRRRRRCVGRSWHRRVEIVAGRGAELLARRLVVDAALA